MENKRPNSPYLSRVSSLVVAGALLNVLMILNGCAADENESESVDCSGVAVSFADDVAPIIQASCTRSSCHGTGSGNGPGELLTYTQINRAKAEIQASVASGQMPKDSRLSTNEKNSILCWIENGATND